MLLKVGDLVRIVGADYGWGDAQKGDTAVIIEVLSNSYLVHIDNGVRGWQASEHDLVLTKGESSSPKLSVQIPKNIDFTAAHLPVLPGTILVPIENPNGHSYMIGEPCLIRSVCPDSRTLKATRMNGTRGNCLPSEDGVTFHSNSVRYADPDEIERFMKSKAAAQYLEQ